MKAPRTDVNGVVNLLKPAGMSSHDAVAFFRRISGVRRVGHTGTLDPMAAGVLLLCVGKATRIAEYLTTGGKRYRCEMRLGAVTDTQDIWGRVLSEAESGFAARLSEELIAETAAGFVGEQMQTPPAYSSVKVKGKKLYEYARAGEHVVVPARKIEITRLDIRRTDLARGIVSFDAECSKGSYMRTLCHDIGLKLGCGAAMSGLVRTACGMFDIADAYTAEAVETAFSPGAVPGGVLTAPDTALGHFPVLKLSSNASRAFVNGVKTDVAVVVAHTKSDALYRVYGDAESRGETFLGIGRVESDTLFPEKVLFRV
ncbi:MAG: tRNA pseudouridine(55) synthase TruB [Clostridiales Family XIII bacterium]|nr:tRNA pseudouridine(55) synthase TruB [Clostridiales Family XIII bacterium]